MKNAFTGHVPHATPFSGAPQFQTVLYRNWRSRRALHPAVTPDWPEYRRAGEMRRGANRVVKKVSA